jgi:hypothetical protein
VDALPNARELTALYTAYRAGEPNPLSPLPVQYADYAAWQRRCVAGELLDGQAAYWRETLAGAPELLALPTDRPRPARADYAGDIIYVNSGTYAEGVTLINGQTLHGEGTALDVGDFNLAAAGAHPTIANASGNSITLAQDNTLTGLTVGDTAAGSFDITNSAATTVGTLTISNVDLTGTGGLFRADSGGVLSVGSDTATTRSATTGIQLAGAALAMTGVVVYVTSPTRHRISVSPMATSSTAGVMLGGRF